MGQPELPCAPIAGAGDTPATRHYRVRVWNQGRLVSAEFADYAAGLFLPGRDAPLTADGLFGADAPFTGGDLLSLARQFAGDGPPPPAEGVCISYGIHAQGEEDATRQALARFTRDTGYRAPDAQVCFLAAWLAAPGCWCIATAWRTARTWTTRKT